MGMIHDTELRQMFQTECAEHLQKLESGLLHLERYPNDAAVLEEMQRELHNLKGASRMLGIGDVESVSHCIEDIFKSISRGEIALTADKINLLEWGLDVLGKMANEALTGTPAEISAPEVVAKLAAIFATVELPVNTAEVSPNIDAIPNAIASVTSEADQEQLTEPKLEAANLKIDTIRVEPKKLDILMIRAGELTVTKTHIERWIGDVEQLIYTWEEMVREVKKGTVDSDSSGHIERINAALYPLRQSAFENAAALNRIAEGLESNIRELRLLPIDRVFQLFPRSVRDLARDLSKEVDLIIQGGETTADKQLIELLKDPLMHLIRNAVYHGVETPEERLTRGKQPTAKITLRAYRTAAHIVIEIIDDGKGLDIDAIKSIAIERNLITLEEAVILPEERIYALIFASGFSTNRVITDISGRGVGLDVVRANVERLKGTITVKSIANQGCSFVITLPLTLATTRVFLITIAEQRYAIPVEFVRMARYVTLSEVFLVQDQETISLHGKAISMAWLANLLELSQKHQKDKKAPAHKQPCLILETQEEQLGIFVDEIVEELEIVLKPAGPLLNRVRNVAGVTILGSGEVCVVLNPLDLIRSAQRRARNGAASWTATEKSAISSINSKDKDKDKDKDKKPLILLAEDSITTRTQEKRILEGAGYEVVTAVDGLAAFNLLTTRPFDALVSDVEMPNMDGLTLAGKVRENTAYETLPIVLVTSLATEADRKRGMDVGADAYIVKSAFNQQVLIDTLNRLV